MVLRFLIRVSNRVFSLTPFSSDLLASAIFSISEIFCSQLVQGWKPTACLFQNFYRVFNFLVIFQAITIMFVQANFSYSSCFEVLFIFQRVIFQHSLFFFSFFGEGIPKPDCFDILVFSDCYLFCLLTDLIFLFFLFFAVFYLLFLFFSFFTNLSSICFSAYLPILNFKTVGAPILSVRCTTFLSRDVDFTSPKPPTRRMKMLCFFCFSF